MTFIRLAIASLFLSAPAFAHDNNDSTSTAATADVVEFRIAAGTGDKPWNKSETPIVVKVGQTLRLVNDDSVAHQLHTLGSPCPHGDRTFNHGETYDCVISSPHPSTNNDLYDHNFGRKAQVYI